MNKLKIETLAQKMQDANRYGDREDFLKAQKEFANWTYKMVWEGRLYCTTENGEMRKVNIKE